MGNDNDAGNARRDAIRAEGERIVSYIAAHPDAALELESYGASAVDFYE